MTPRVRFPDFTEAWRFEKLGSMFDVRDGTHESPSYQKVGKPLVTSKNLRSNGTLDLQNVSLISQHDFENINKRSAVDVGDILFGMIGTIGNPVRVVSNDFAIKNVALIKPRSSLTAYLIQYLQTPIVAWQFHHKNAGGTQKFLALGDIRTLTIGVPEDKEQQKIADFFGTMDEKIARLERKAEGLTAYRRSVIQRIFTRSICFRDSKDMEYPEWKKVNLADFLSIPQKELYTTVARERILTVRLHLRGVTKNTNTETLRIGSTTYYVRHSGQFIFGKQNLFSGALGIVPKELDGFVSSGDVPAFDINRNVIDPRFLLYAVGRSDFYKKLEKLASGSGSRRIHESTLLGVEIMLPGIEEQQKIVDFLSAIDAKIELVRLQLAKAKIFKKSLLQRMLV